MQVPMRFGAVRLIPGLLSSEARWISGQVFQCVARAAGRDLLKHTCDHAVTTGEVELKGTGRCRACSCKEVIPQQCAGSVEARFDVLLTDLQAFRGLGRTQAFDLSQCEDDAMVLWESVNR